MMNGQISKTPGRPPRWQTVATRNISRSAAMGLIVEVSDFTGVSVDEIMGKSRVAGIVHARKLAYLALHDAGAPYAHIGRIMGRDHTSVMSGIRQVLGK